MNLLKSTFLSLVCAALWLPSHSLAQTQYRGMAVAADISEQDIIDLAAYNPNVVRYNLAFDSEGDTATVEQYNTWLGQQLDTLETLLPIFTTHGMKVVVCLFTPPGGFARRTSPAQHRIFAESAFQQAYTAAWVTIATRLANSTAIYGYDILNEPAQPSVASGLKTWSQLAQETADAIRAVDSTHTIIVEPINGNPAKLGALKPLTTSNVMYSIHAYFPLSFIHQGLYGRKLGVRYPKTGLNKAALKKHLKRAVTYARKNNARFYVGEFSSVRWAPGRSSYFYLRDMISIFEQQGWDWTYHAWREANVWSVEHTNNRNSDATSPTLTDRAKLLRKYFAKNAV